MDILKRLDAIYAIFENKSSYNVNDVMSVLAAAHGIITALRNEIKEQDSEASISCINLKLDDEKVDALLWAVTAEINLQLKVMSETTRLERKRMKRRLETLEAIEDELSNFTQKDA